MKYGIQSSQAFVAEAVTVCWKCGASTSVICVYCDTGTIEGHPAESFYVSNLSHVNELLADALKGWPFFRMDFSKTAEMSYLANHCERCDALQGDFYLHSEPGGAFFPETPEATHRIKFTPVVGMSEMTGIDGYGPMEDAFAQRAK